jgi:adenylate cyclase class IV
MFPALQLIGVESRPKRWEIHRSSTHMAANIEIKARARNWDDQWSRARRLADGEAVLIEQVDTFFAVPVGRLKLREFDSSTGELIFYQRPDELGPKRSEYSIATTDRPAALRETLARALGVSGEVKKRRWLHLTTAFGGHTRIHFDEVKGLGQYLELEVVLSASQQSEDGERIAQQLCAALDIAEEDLIECAYLDLLTAHSGGGL